jgi:prefoldin subunit 4
MMGNGDKVLLSLGEAFFEVDEDAATLFCEEDIDKNQKILDALQQEEEDIVEQQAALKKILYGRFGKSINLEEK